MAYDLRILGLGGGNDSSGVLLAYLTGELQGWIGQDLHLDCAIFADTGAEPKEVYPHVQYLKDMAADHGFPVFTVQIGDIRQDMIDVINDTPDAHLSTPPMFVKKEDGEVVMLSRRCTSDYKTAAIRRKVRELLGGSVRGKKVQQWYGVTADEIQRVKDADVKYIDHYYPLIDANKTKWDIFMWTQRAGFKNAPKSACDFCPFHSNEYWAAFKKRDPEAFAKVCDLEDGIRNKLPGVKYPAYFHRSCIPLREVPFDNPDQLSLFDMEEECGGVCGI